MEPFDDNRPHKRRLAAVIELLESDEDLCQALAEVAERMFSHKAQRRTQRPVPQFRSCA